MEWIFWFIALIGALAGLVAALGHGGYVYMLNAAARKRAGGEPVAKFARGRYGVAAAGLAAGLIALLITATGQSFGADLVGLLIGLGTAGGSAKALQTSREGLRLGGRTR